jgi:para-nitrobenzyl esterase
LFPLIALIIVFLLSIRVNAADEFVVNIASGQLKGVKRSLGGAEFLAIPYARPPVDDLRWRDPQPPKPWTTIRDATTFGAPCAQPVLGDWNKHDSETSKEDCLFLNVMTPVWPPKAPLPVMVWFHGGANAGGTASSPLYKDGTLVQHGVVLVTVNYRLGIFGFFAYPALTKESAHHSSGNYGLFDQLLALHWVRDNIAKFGGDPANVTVFGQSAGAIDAGYLMVSPLAKGLFQRLIAQSGSPLGPPLPKLSEAEQANEKLVAALKPPPGNELQFLRQESAQELIEIAGKQDPQAPPAIGPIIDGRLLPRHPAEILNAGEQAPVTLLMGTTTREFGFNGPPDAVRGFIQSVTGNLADRAFALYDLANGESGNSDPLYGSAGDQWFADLAFRCPTTTEAIWHTAARHPVYQYELLHAIPGQEAAVHSTDLPYVFGYFPKQGNISGNFGETDFKLADLIETYFTNFARTGDPNSTRSGVPNSKKPGDPHSTGPGGPNSTNPGDQNSKGLPKWPEFEGSQAYIDFRQDGSVATSTGLRRAYCDLYRDVWKQRLNDGH